MRDFIPEWRKNKRDDNEPAIVAMMKSVGAAWRSCSRHEGHDGWCLFAETWYCVEVKNPRQRWELTPAEKAMQRFCEQNGAKYWILQYPDDVLKMLELE